MPYKKDVYSPGEDESCGGKWRKLNSGRRIPQAWISLVRFSVLVGNKEQPWQASEAATTHPSTSASLLLLLLVPQWQKGQVGDTGQHCKILKPVQPKCLRKCNQHANDSQWTGTLQTSHQFRSGSLWSPVEGNCHKVITKFLFLACGSSCTIPPPTRKTLACLKSAAWFLNVNYIGVFGRTEGSISADCSTLSPCLLLDAKHWCLRGLAVCQQVWAAATKRNFSQQHNWS